MRFLSLFAGIGGFDLGLERAGMECVGQVEIDPFCQKVLAKHWPNVWRWDDVKSLTDELIRQHCGRVDAIVGGFPCQDLSYAGKGAGIEGERSGLWSEINRLVREIQPRFVIVENVAALLGRGMGRVLGDLATCGYDAEWRVFSACEMGLPHSRERVFLVAYPASLRPSVSIIALCEEAIKSRQRDAKIENWQFNSLGQGNASPIRGARRRIEPPVLRVVNDFPGRMDAIKSLGNAIVPQVAEVIGRAIMQMDGGER